MGSAREKVEGLEGIEVIMRCKKGKVTGLGGGVTREIDNGDWVNFNEAMNEVGMTARTRRIKDDGGVGSDEIESGFGFGKMSGDVGMGWRSEGGGKF